jgi:hypothetical protein
MRTTTMLLAIGCVGAIALGTPGARRGAVLLPAAAGLRLRLPTTGRPLRLRMDLEQLRVRADDL